MTAPTRARPLWPYLAGIASLAISAHLGLGAAALDRLGLSPWEAVLLLLLAVACRSSTVHLHVMRDGRQRLHRFPDSVRQAVLKWRSPFAEETAVTLSVGGAIVPLCFCVYVLSREPVSPPALWMAAILVVATIEFVGRMDVRGAAMPRFALAAPATALLPGWTLGGENRTALAYVGGVAGILAGADLLHLHDLRHIGQPEVVIGGDASFGAIFLIQLFALLFS